MVVKINKDKCDRNRMCVIVSACPVGAIKQKMIGPILADYPEIDPSNAWDVVCAWMRVHVVQFI